MEPDEECPIHGAGEWPPRCCICGRFLKRKYEESEGQEGTVLHVESNGERTLHRGGHDTTVLYAERTDGPLLSPIERGPCSYAAGMQS